MSRTKKKIEPAPDAIAEAAPAEKPIIAYKGFDKDLRCRGFQYAVGETYTHDGKIEICESGFHACLNPFDVLSYYGLSESRFAEVELRKPHKKTDGDTKIAAAKITIKAELKLPYFIGRAIDWIIAATALPAPNKKAADTDTLNDNGSDGARIGSSGNGARIGSSGYGAQIGSSGYGAQIGSSGYGAQIGSSGYGAQIGSSGYDAQIGSSGYGARIGSSGDNARIGSSGNDARIGSSGYGARIGSSGYDAQIGSSGNDAQIGSSGYGARIGSSGYDAQIGSSGNDAQIGSSGDNARIGSSGNDARIESSGERAVITSAGINTRAKGALGAWISLAEFNENSHCIGFAIGCIGHDDLKPDTWYCAKGGKLVEAA